MGASGFAKEVDWLLYEIDCSYKVHYFVAKENIGQKINNSEIISDDDFATISHQHNSNDVFISMGNPAIKYAVHQKLKQQEKMQFPTIIHPSVAYDRRDGKVIMGQGNIICAGNILTTDIAIGNFVHINLDCTVGHDSCIGDYTTISPGVHVSGNVIIGQRVFIGTGAVLFERISICDDAVIGAGSVVTKPISGPGVYAGIPAKKIK